MGEESTESASSSSGAELRQWLLGRDWARVLAHFADREPADAQGFEARALATMATRAGAEGARAALADLRRACALEPRNVLMAANLMQALIDAGDVAEALRLTTDAMRQAPQIHALADKHAWALTAAARWDDARRAATHALHTAAVERIAPAPALRELAAELETRWWQPVVMADVTLHLPDAGDAGFVGQCFRDAAFMARLHRYQAGDDAAVATWIARAARRPSVNRRLDWVIWHRDRREGLAGLVDHDAANRRAELLLGLPRPDPPAAVALKAALAVMHFAFDRAGLAKLTSCVYGDNPAAQANTLHLGLRQEACLREHLLLPTGPIDLYLNGLLADEYRRDARLQRLLARWRGGASPPAGRGADAARPGG